MHIKPRELDVVALLADVPEHGLVPGQVGTVEVLDGAYEIEFSDDTGKTYANSRWNPLNSSSCTIGPSARHRFRRIAHRDDATFRSPQGLCCSCARNNVAPPGGFRNGPQLSRTLERNDPSTVRRMRIVSLLLLLSSSLAASSPPDAAPDAAQALPRITQKLLDAVGEGNTALWDRYLADSCLYIAEDGRVLTKTELLAGLEPLPPGYEGSLRMANAVVRDYGGTAVITYDALEQLTLFGQRIDTRFHTTDTWIRRDGEWRMIASQVSMLPGNPAPVEIDPAIYTAYVGQYALADGVVYTVTQEGGKLFVAHGGKKEELFPLDRRRFFRKGRRGEVIFVMGGNGVADKLIQRRDNNDIVWMRVSALPRP